MALGCNVTLLTNGTAGFIEESYLYFRDTPFPIYNKVECDATQAILASVVVEAVLQIAAALPMRTSIRHTALLFVVQATYAITAPNVQQENSANLTSDSAGTVWAKTV